MRRLSRTGLKKLISGFMQEVNEEKRRDFLAFGNGGWYTHKQKNYAFELISKSGIRASARILHLHRRTLQRWCRRYGIAVSRCPEWVYVWAGRRRGRRKFWSKRGY